MMGITHQRAERLRPLIDDLISACAEFDDILASLEDSEVKGEERNETSDQLDSALNEIATCLRPLIAAMPGGEAFAKSASEIQP